MKWYVYILLTKNNHYYIGSTKDINKRLIQHQRWDVTTTNRLSPVTLIFSRQYTNIEDAKNIESWLKNQKQKN